MIVCSCNVLSDHEVREAARSAKRRSTSHVYGCLGCSAQCGRCAHTIRKIVDEVLGAGSLACPVGCACALHDAAPSALSPVREHHHHHHHRRHSHPAKAPAQRPATAKIVSA